MATRVMNEFHDLQEIYRKKNKGIRMSRRRNASALLGTQVCGWMLVKD